MRKSNRVLKGIEMTPESFGLDRSYVPQIQPTKLQKLGTALNVLATTMLVAFAAFVLVTLWVN